MNYRGTISYRSGIGRPIDEGFTASFIGAWSFLHQNRSDEHLRYHYHFMRGLSCMLHDSANQIAQGFLGEWVLFLDTDHVFRSDAFFEMIHTFEDNNLDILTGFTQKRQPPYHPLIFRTDFDPLYDFETIFPTVIEKNMLLPVDSSGLGCLMVRRKVFETINERLHELPFDFRSKFRPPPRFVHNEHVYQGHHPRPEELPPGRRWDEMYWEDTSFYWRAAICGFRVFCAPWIKFHHLEQRQVTDEMIQKTKVKSTGVLER